METHEASLRRTIPAAQDNVPDPFPLRRPFRNRHSGESRNPEGRGASLDCVASDPRQATSAERRVRLPFSIVPGECLRRGRCVAVGVVPIGADAKLVDHQQDGGHADVQQYELEVGTDPPAGIISSNPVTKCVYSLREPDHHPDAPRVEPLLGNIETSQGKMRHR